MATKAAAGNSPRTGKLKIDSTAVIGSTGLRQWGGFIDEEFLTDLKGTKAARVYREMSDNDGVVGAILYAVSMLMRETPWTVTAVDETPAAADAKAFVEECFDKMKTPLQDVIDEVCSMFTYGYAPMEITWRERDDGNIGIDSIQLRAQPTIYRWQIDDADGSIDGLWQQPWSGPQVFIPIEKLLLFRTTVTRNNPEGRSLLRTAYRAWRNKKIIEEIEAVGLERDLAGLPIARIPGQFFGPDADSDQKAVLAAYQTLVRNLRRDKQQGIVIPSDTDSKGKPLYDVALMTSGGTRAVDTSTIVGRYDRQIATSVLADFIFLGQSSRGGGSGGSYSLSSDKTAMFSSAIMGFAKTIAAVVQRHLLPRLWELNAFNPDLMPSFGPGDIEKQDLDKLGMFITALAGAGMALFPDRELENHLRQEAGLPEAPDDSEEGPSVKTPEPPSAVPIVGPHAAAATAEMVPPPPPPPPAPPASGGAAAPPSRQKTAGKGGRKSAKSQAPK